MLFHVTPYYNQSSIQDQGLLISYADCNSPFIWFCEEWALPDIIKKIHKKYERNPVVIFGAHPISPTRRGGKLRVWSTRYDVSPGRLHVIGKNNLFLGRESCYVAL